MLAPGNKLKHIFPKAQVNVNTNTCIHYHFLQFFMVYMVESIFFRLFSSLEPRDDNFQLADEQNGSLLMKEHEISCQNMVSGAVCVFACCHLGKDVEG